MFIIAGTILWVIPSWNGVATGFLTGGFFVYGLGLLYGWFRTRNEIEDIVQFREEEIYQQHRKL